MFQDARSIPDGRVFESDLCIAGAGAAGLTLATALAGRGLDTILVESGHFRPEPETQALYEGRIVDDDYPPLTVSRLRYFGGTTNHWAGTCRPLDSFELEPHDWLPGSGWPIRRAELDPYYARARTLLGLPRPHFDFDPAEAQAQDDEPLLGPAQSDFPTVIFRNAPGPPLLGRSHRNAIAGSPHVRCLLNANAIELVPDESHRRITSLRIATLNGRRHVLRARRFVLCTGAIENARLLLLSGVGNQHDQVGRYFADHGFGHLGDVHVATFPTRRRFQVERFLPGEGLDHAGFATSTALRERHRLLGFSVYPVVNDTEAYRKAAEETRPGPTTALVPATDPSEWESQRVLPLVYVAEKSPNPESRVLLQEETDALGLRRVAVDLNVREGDWQSLRESARLLGAAVARAGIGRMRLEPLEGKPWCRGTGGHQNGTTRMSDDPRKGVTDRNGRVHGVQNLYCAGGSLHPTTGWQHPTFTIVALALRLADHLADAAQSPG